MMNHTTFVTNGSRVAVINQQCDRLWWNLYVNCKNVDGRVELGDITTVRGKAKTLNGATKAAEKAVNA